MKDKNILFITYDLSGYYNCIHEELIKQFANVDYYNMANLKFKYKNAFQKTYSGIYKLITKKKLKNYYKLQPILNETQGKKYDYILIVRPDLFFDSQLKKLKNKTENFIAYYHDSINNITRKKEVIHFFDKVYSYEKKDVTDYNLEFIPNFIYLNSYSKNTNFKYDLFTIMSCDYRMSLLNNLAKELQKNKISYQFLVQHDKPKKSDLITYITTRKNNQEVLELINNSKILVDIHKYNTQQGLTFRVFESLFFNKKLITSNQDIKNYSFYNPNNILIIKEGEEISIPANFLNTAYTPVPKEIYLKHHHTTWISTVLNLKPY